MANLIGSLIFGSIGFVALAYGKKQADMKRIIIGIALIGYPFFISKTAAMYGVGILLTAALFIG